MRVKEIRNLPARRRVLSCLNAHLQPGQTRCFHLPIVGQAVPLTGDLETIESNLRGFTGLSILPLGHAVHNAGSNAKQHVQAPPGT